MVLFWLVSFINSYMFVTFFLSILSKYFPFELLMTIDYMCDVPEYGHWTQFSLFFVDLIGNRCTIKRMCGIRHQMPYLHVRIGDKHTHAY